MIAVKMMLQIVFAWLPVASGMAWGVFMWLSYYDSLTPQEARLKRLLALFLGVSAFAWFSLFTYTWLPGWFAVLNVPAYLAFLLAPIQFYRFISALANEPARRFSWGHYVAPLLVCGVLLAWSFSVPREVDLALVEGRGAIYPGWEAYSRLFLSKPLMRFVFNLIYMGLSLACLYRYYLRITQERESRGKYPSEWVLLLMALTLSLMVATVVVALLPRGGAFRSVAIGLPILLQISQHILLVYNVVRRNFLPYALSVPLPPGKRVKAATEVATEVEKPDEAPPAERKRYTRYAGRPVTRRRFEAYMRENKPFLNPRLTITDVTDGLQVNRTYLSNFINQTYGMNFNVYIGQCRLKELERLRKLPSNARKTKEQLVRQAGFGSYPSYMRARELREKRNEEGEERRIEG